MPRKGHIGKKETVADPIYNSTLVTKFINSMMWDGKRSTAQGIFYNAMSNLQAKGGDEAIKLFKKAVENTKPLLEVKTRRVGGANYQVPVEVNPDRRTSLAIRWIVSYARGRGEKGMVDKLTRPEAYTYGYRVNLPPHHELEPAGLAEGPLRELATASGGRFYREEDLPKLVESIEAKNAPFTLRREILLWNPLTLLVFIGLVTTEWVVRKLTNLI